ncbi:hypothetical protein V474_02080 [Novosphingobium barchaimii LL02]|uniref:histidine kinase n=1 Tax=Novosphingobium barchaimii LL02 TaxID=1114963 RepID=A0A0J7XIJ6_9SPHN|nr:HAMP domain-containing sensor histidine kinase [Novosphingobium barchaimii]KMS51851.1 hypothetical protein V474_02080 [Novosphingobium barchaimii LL02]
MGLRIGRLLAGRRLFWKILLAFLVTFVVMTQVVWLLFALRGDREPPEFLMTRHIGPPVLEAAVQAVGGGGPARYRAMLANLPEDSRHRLELVAEGTRPARLGEGYGVLERRVRDPTGARYLLRFRYHRDDSPGLLNIPPELVLTGVLAGLVFSGLLAWYLLAPINHLRRGFERLARGELATRVSPAIGARRDEVADLAHEFDRTARLIEQLVQGRDRLLHDVSHELRSPLARLQLAIALARQTPARTESAMDRMEREVERLDGLVGELLTLARAENEQDPGDDYFDLVGVAASVIADACYEAQPAGIEITFDAPGEEDEERPPVRGSSELMRRAIENVVRNALRFSPPKGRIEVGCVYLAGEASFRLSVVDEGPGVPPDLIDTLFEPFVRGKADGQGLGLGLAIASRAVAAHKGRIVAANLPGQGLKVEFEIPAKAL